MFDLDAEFRGSVFLKASFAESIAGQIVNSGGQDVRLQVSRQER
jgi:hypothetical protein